MSRLEGSGAVKGCDLVTPSYTKDKGKNLTQEELVVKQQNRSRELLTMNPKLTSAKVGDISVSKPGMTVV